MRRGRDKVRAYLEGWKVGGYSGMRKQLSGSSDD